MASSSGHPEVVSRHQYRGRRGPAGGQRFPGMARRAEDRRLPNEHRASRGSPTRSGRVETTSAGHQCDDPRMRRALIVIAVALAFVATGCGSDSPDNTASANQIQTFADQQLELRLDDNQSADPFTCEEDGDDQHWTCTTEVRTDSPDASADETVELTVNVTCDSTGSCTYTPET